MFFFFIGNQSTWTHLFSHRFVKCLINRGIISDKNWQVFQKKKNCWVFIFREPKTQKPKMHLFFSFVEFIYWLILNVKLSFLYRDTKCQATNMKHVHNLYITCLTWRFFYLLKFFILVWIFKNVFFLFSKMLAINEADNQPKTI